MGPAEWLDLLLRLWEAIGVGRSVDVRVRRIYDPVESDDGTRVLVDRLWPRGLKRDAVALDDWCKQVAPSSELRAWYRHAPERFEEFSRRYEAELEEPERAAALAKLVESSRKGRLTLLTATKAVEISQAAVLARVIDRQGG